MLLPTIRIKEHPDQFDAWLERFVSEEYYSPWPLDHSALKLVPLPLYKGRVRYELWRDNNLVLELERMPISNDRLDIRVAMLIGRIPGLPFADLVEQDGQQLRPMPDAHADAGFCNGFYREINTIYEPEWSNLPRRVVGHQPFQGKLTNVQLSTMIVECYRLHALEKHPPYPDAELERDRLAKIEKYSRKRLSPFPMPESKPLENSPGRPRLSESDPDGYIDRLVFAQEAKEIRSSNPTLPWREIARIIEWPMGNEEEGVKALARARKELQNATEDILTEVVKRRTEKTKKTEKT